MSALLGWHASVLGSPSFSCNVYAQHRSSRDSMVSSLPFSAYHSSPSSEQKLKGRRTLLFLVGIFSNPFLDSCSRAYSDQEPQKLRIIAQESDIIEQQTMENHSKKVSSASFMDIGSADMLLNNENSIKENFQSPLLFYLNAAGYLASGVLGGLFWFEREMRMSSETILQDLKSKLKAKEHALLALRQNRDCKFSSEDKNTQLEFEKSKEEITFNELKYPIQQLESELQAKRIMKQDLLKQINVFEAAIEETERNKADLKQNHLWVLDKKGNLEVKINELKLEMEEKEADVNELRLECGEKEQAIANLLLTVNDKKVSLKNLQCRIEEMDQQFDQEHKQLLKNESDTKDARAMLEVAIAKGVEVDKDVIAATKDLDFLKQSFAEKLKSIQEDIKNNREECKVLTEVFAMTLRDSGQRKKTISDLQDEMNSFKEKIQEVDAAIKNVNEDLALCSQTANTTKEEMHFLFCDLKYLKTVNERLEEQLSELRLKLGAQLMSLKHALNQEQRFSFKFKEEIKVVSDNLDKSTRSISLLAEEAARCEDLCDQLERKVSESVDCAKLICITLEKEREITATSKKDLNSARQKMSETKKIMKSLQKDLEKAKLEREDLLKGISNLNEQLDIHNNRVSGLQANRHSVVNENKVSNLKNEVNGFDGTLGFESTEAESKQLKEKSGSIIREVSPRKLVRSRNPHKG